MGGLRKLRRMSGDRHYAVEPLQPKRPPGARKMSEVLLEFAEPLLDHLEDDSLFESAIGFAAICWSISLFPDQEQGSLLKKVVGELAKASKLSRFEVEKWVQMLLERKKTLFAGDRRMVADFRVVREKGHHHLFVMSTLVKDKPQVGTD
jgi:hypothetical protein